MQSLPPYTSSSTMKELIETHNIMLPVISRFDIPFGFGDASIGQVCADAGVDTATFLAVSNLLCGRVWSAHNISLPTLIDYLKRAHTSFFEITFPRIRYHLIEAINFVHSDEAALLLIRFYDDYVKEVRKHMEHENEVIFRYAERLLQNQPDPDFRISTYGGNHESMSEKLMELKNIFIYHYKKRDNARLSATLFDIIMCEKDLISHFEVENNLFIPAVEELEERLKDFYTDEPNGEGGGAEEGDEPSAADLLSEREKDIIRSLAKGKSNKEIADELFISTHTVATHRRNISAKLDIHSPAGLTIFALIHHIIDLDSLSASK